ncbi:MAG: GNAT family N-acetyltransferase [Candidatus Hodarchaeota archaeon]
MNSEVPIELKKSQLAATTEMLARVFQEGMFYKAVIPDELERKRILPIVFKFRLKLCINYGKVFIDSPNLHGVLNVFSPGNTKLTMWKFIRSGILSTLRKVPREIFSRYKQLADIFTESHETLAPFPHYYINALGVDSPYQGKGVGGKLMRFVIQKADDEGFPCYLETQEPVNVSIYKHLGFKVAEENTLPIINIKNWIMIHHPEKGKY